MTSRGFTLIELVVAMAITAVVSAAAFAGWRAVTGVERALDAVQTQLAELERAFLILDRDISQMMARPIRDELGGERDALAYSDYSGAEIEFTRAGWFNPAPELIPPRSELQRVAYRVEDEALVRRAWYHLDRMVEGDYADRQLLAAVDAVVWRFLDDEGTWQSTWPPTNTDTSDPNAKRLVPRAIELALTHAELGELTRWFEVP
ncbi:MAG: type II secretion system minor pseudopilin GspJ [Pseudomonadota bacterium]